MDSVTMRRGNKGLTVKINLFALEKYLDRHDSKSARLWLRGTVTHGDTKQQVNFNDGGELLTTIGKWNSQQYQKLKKIARLRISSRKV